MHRILEDEGKTTRKEEDAAYEKKPSASTYYQVLIDERDYSHIVCEKNILLVIIYHHFKIFELILKSINLKMSAYNF